MSALQSVIQLDEKLIDAAARLFATARAINADVSQSQQQAQDAKKGALVPRPPHPARGPSAPAPAPCLPVVPPQEQQAQQEEWPFLPICPDSVRPVPNRFLRSALFGSPAKGRRTYLKEEPIAAVDGVSISYTGERLDQGDLDVWQSLVHSVKDQKVGTPCRITTYSLLKLMGITDNGKNRATLCQRIKRLVANALTIKTERYSYFGSLIYDAYKEEKTQEWVIQINPKMLQLFNSDQFTMIDWSVRRDLHGKPLAQWLHGFYSTHAKPYPYRVETLLKMSGSENSDRHSGKQKLVKALLALAAASCDRGQPFRFEITGGLVQVQKSGSDSQRRHIANRAN